MRLEGKTILLTGASSGIGRSIAEKLSEYQCILILIARRYELLNELKEQFAGNPAVIKVYSCDVSDKEQVIKTSGMISDEVGTVDLAILNSGAGHRVTPENFNSRYAEEIFGANVFGIIYWVEQLLPVFLNKERGVIVGVTSMADNRGYSGSGFYSASKAAASIFLEGLRVELADSNIKVITVRPGFVRTPMTDKNEFHMPFLMEPDEAADIIVTGIEKEKKYIEFPRIMFWITKIIGMLPARLYEYFAHKQYRNMRKKNETV